MSGLSVAKSLGHHGHWGFSAGFDVLEGLTNDTLEHGEGPINILLVQPGDIRHILYTIARRRRYRKNKMKPLRAIHFYLYESTVEILARNLLLLEVINDYEVPIRQRANTFLEIYGNNKVQRRTSAYIEQLGNQLRLLVTKGIGQLDNVIDFSLLRYREKDELEIAFKAYAKSSVFDMNSLYDHRQRGLYEDRYDARKALFDWDYHSTLKQKASIVHIKQYKEWRGSGLAFEFGDQTYSEPNKTLMSYTEGTMKKGKEQGLKKDIKGFWGDISSSPYLSFGVDSETPNKHAEGLYEIYNKNTGTEQHRHHAVEIALYNLFAVLWETETGQAYRMTRANDVYSGLGAEASIHSSKLDSLEGSGESLSVSAEGEGEKVREEDKDSLLPVIEATEEEEEEKEGEIDMPLTSKNTRDESAADIDLTTDNQSSEGETAAPSSSSSSSSSSSAALAVSEAVSSASNSSANKEETDPLTTRARDVAKAVLRAEAIEESYSHVKVLPLTGSTSSAIDKARFKAFFDCVFISSRSAQVLSEGYVGSLLKEDGSAYAAVETGKFLAPLSQSLKEELLKKEVQLAEDLGWKRVSPAPVRRRRRDELDKEDDVVFFRR